MRDRLGITDNVSIRLIRGEPVLFYLHRPITADLKIPKDCPYPHLRYDDYIEFHVLAHSEEEADTLLNGVLYD
jgi:hypothetical protein